MRGVRQQRRSENIREREPRFQHIKEFEERENIQLTAIKRKRRRRIHITRPREPVDPARNRHGPIKLAVRSGGEAFGGFELVDWRAGRVRGRE
jgi:hypothetical protein